MSSSPQENRPLYISRLDVKVSERSRKEVKSIKLDTRNKTLKDFQAVITPGNSYKQTFIPALVLKPGDPFYVSLPCRTPYRHKEVKIAMDHHDISSRAVENGATRKYEKTVKNIDAIVSFHLLRPSMDEILEICPWFRVLIIGNSGVGKTSLIKKVFGVDEIHAANFERGVTDINTEFVSSQNGRFIFHDSNGFEEAETNNMETVERFVRGLCLEIPYSDGRLLQSGVEGFLQRRRDILGSVPLVVVLTKADLLDSHLRIKMMNDNSEGMTFEQRRSEFLERYCTGPLRRAAGDVPYVTVSTCPGYSTTHADVIKTSQGCVAINIGEDPSAVIAAAQRASVKINIESSIAIGRKKYWSRLAKSAFLSGHTLRECVKVLHEDIVTVWNFDDPDEILRQEKFIDDLFRTADFDQPSSASFLVSILTALGVAKEFVASNLSNEPVSTVVLASAHAAIWTAKLVYEAHQQSTPVIKNMMLYIVGSMFIMQIIFVLSPEGRVTSEVVDLAIYTYLLSKKQEVREHIEGFNIERGLYPGGPDHILGEVERLIRSLSLTDEEIKELRHALRQQHSETTQG